MSDGEADPTYWWGQPMDARRFHIFEGEHAMAQCVCDAGWMLSHHGNDPEVDPEEDEYTPGEDCKQCSRRMGVLE